MLGLLGFGLSIEETAWLRYVLSKGWLALHGGLCKTLIIASRYALSEMSKTDDTPYQIMSNGFSGR